MQLNTIKPAPGSKRARRRVARGIGSGLGKTAGRGHKGQHARSGGFHKVGFEGGQMPLQRRLPKRGFKSMSRNDTAEVRLSDLERLPGEKIDLAVLKEAGVVPGVALKAKVILSGKLTRKVVLAGLSVSKGARAAIEGAGGSTDAPMPQPRVKREPKPVPPEALKPVKARAEPKQPKADAKSGAEKQAEGKARKGADGAQKPAARPKDKKGE